VTLCFLLLVGLARIDAQVASENPSQDNFYIKVDWLAKRFTGMRIDEKRGLSFISPNYVSLNANILKVQFASAKMEQKPDLSGTNLLFTNQMSGTDIFLPRGISFDDYYQMKTKTALRKQLNELIAKSAEEEKKAPTTEKIELIGADIAGQRVSLQVSGNVNINGKLQNQKRSQVRSGYQEGQSTTFIIDQKQQLSIEGKIGDRISILVDQDSERDFDFENALKIVYTGHEDDIVQKIEAGNVALSLPGTQFVTFSGKNNGLFGLKALMKLGPVDVTTIASVEKGKKEKLSVDGGAQTSTGYIKDYDYRKNQYFFLDMTYRGSLYTNFQTTGILTFDPNRIVSDLEVYKSVTTETAGCVYGTAWVNPNNESQNVDQKEEHLFKRLDLSKDYSVNLNTGILRVATQLQESEVLAVAYRVIDAAGNTVEECGQWDRTTADTNDIKLKIIKPQQLLPSHPCWDLELKNIYFLGTTGINEDGFDLSIVYNWGKNGDTDRDETDGKTYLEKFGLDRKDKSGNASPDNIIDSDNESIINLQTGELWFPFLRPFQYKENDLSGERNPNLDSANYNCSAMYDSNRTNTSAINEDTKFKIKYSYENRSSNISLGAMVIENSESVTLNGQTLTRGVDYTIDYFSGSLTLLKDEATNPDAKLDIKYEKNQFFQLDKKTILGARAQYDFGENSYIGGTALYFSQSVVDEKVDVGYEPMRNFVWDLNTKLSKNLNFLTRAVDWLPLVQTNETSNISFEGEIAQVRPNPNTLSNESTDDPDGVGFIDDFEGSKRITSPPIMRQYWSLSAVPVGKTQNQRGFAFWFNPYGGVATTSIWPNKEVSTRAQNNLTEVLGIAMNPKWSIRVGDGLEPAENAWGGITYYFPTSYYDQSKTKYVEIWVRGKTGQLHLDLGYISEDQDGNGALNTEDKPELTYTGNGLLDNGEDIGLDGVMDEKEEIVNSFGDTLSFGDSLLTKYARETDDPHSDNWSWKETSTNYRHINGTEGNENDVNGLYPDTEDLNSNIALDEINDYFSVDFNLDDNKDEQYIAGRTEYSNGQETGWKLYRIPLSEFQKIKSDATVTWQTIRSCRLWVDGFSDEDTLWIAKIEMVGNEWEEVGIAPSETESFVVNTESFSVSVVNSEDNPDTYEAPDGVQGEYDRINEIRMKEQSLVLWFDGEEGLQPGALCAAKKVLAEEASFITYKKMKLFVNGSNIHSRSHIYQDGEQTPLQFFIKFGRLEGPNFIHYYEYRQPIYPGWDSNNKMEIDLDFITQLKSYMTEESFPDNDQHPKQFRIYYDDTGEIVKRHYREVKDGKYTGIEIIIVGNVALSRITRIDIGLKNQKYSLDDLTESSPYSRYDNTMYGEVWLDELRLSEVRRDAGIAYRTKASLKIADLATLDISMDRRDADFHTVEQRPSLTTDALNTTESFRIGGRISLDKFTPSSWGVRLPLNGAYSQNISTPKYIPGQDVLVGDSPPDSTLSISRSYSMNISYEKRASDYWLTKYTIDQIKAGFSAQWANNSTVTYKDNDAQNYKANMSYRVPFGKENYFKIFKWISSVPYIGNKLGEVRWYYTPSNLDFSFDTAEDIKNTVTRGSASDTNYTHTLAMNSRINLSYKFFDNLNLTYSKDLKNNMDELKNDKWQAVQRLNFGVPVSVRENYSASFSPKIFKWLSPNINYTANYSWAEPMGSETKSLDQLSNQNRVSTSFQLDLASILNSVYSPTKTTTSPQPASGRTPTRGRSSGRSTEEQSESPGELGERGRPAPSEQSEKMTQPSQTDNKKVVKQEPDEPKQIKSLDILSKYLKKLSAIQFSYSFSQSVNSKYRTYGTPGIAYRMGFTPDPGLSLVELEKGVGKDNITTGMDASLRSGLSITPNINTSLSFAQNISLTNSAGQTGRNLSRDFFPMGKNGKDGFPFPNWTVGWNNLEKMKLLNKVFKKLSLDHGFSGKEAIVWKNGKVMNSSYKIYFQPLLSVNMQFKNDMTATARMTQGSTINNRDAATEITDEMGIQTTVNFQKKGGFTIPLPFLKDKRLENNITFALTYDYNSSMTRTRAVKGGKFVTQSENNSWKIAPRIGYSFTKKVTGSIYYEYGESFNRSTGRRTTKNGGFDVNIAIRG